MPVPDNQFLMAPTLNVLADGGEHSLAELRTVLADRLALSEEDLRAKIPSGTPLFANRLHWAVTYMYQAGLLSRPKRGVVCITDRGRKMAAAHRDRIDVRVLSEFPEFIDFKSRSHQPRQTDEPDLAQGGTTPREAVSTAVGEANAAVATEVLDRVRQREPAFLERLVLAVLTALGYGGAAGAAEHLGKAGDEGLDGVIRQDPLGGWIASTSRPSDTARAGLLGGRRSRNSSARCTAPRRTGASSLPRAGSRQRPSRTQTGWPPESS
jgi:restriction system protein